MNKTHVVIVAAGSSSRMKGVNKMLFSINGYPIIYWSVKTFDKNRYLNSIVLVIKKSDQAIFKKWGKEWRFAKLVSIIPGGLTRQESVTKGIESLKNVHLQDIILVHDGARPLVKTVDINRVILSAQKNGAAILAVKTNDTVKIARNNLVVQTLNREEIWLAQTPQAATYNNFQKALKLCKDDNFTVTDESSLFEYAKIPIKIIPTENINIKITTKKDLKIVQSLMK